MEGGKTAFDRKHIGIIQSPTAAELAEMRRTSTLRWLNCCMVLPPDAWIKTIWDAIVLLCVCLATGFQAFEIRWQAQFVDCEGCWIYADKHDDNPYAATSAQLQAAMTTVLILDIVIDARTGFDVEIEIPDPGDPARALVACTHRMMSPWPVLMRYLNPFRGGLFLLDVIGAVPSGWTEAFWPASAPQAPRTPRWQRSLAARVAPLRRWARKRSAKVLRTASETRIVKASCITGRALVALLRPKVWRMVFKGARILRFVGGGSARAGSRALLRTLRQLKRFGVFRVLSVLLRPTTLLQRLAKWVPWLLRASTSLSALKAVTEFLRNVFPPQRRLEWALHVRRRLGLRVGFGVDQELQEWSAGVIQRSWSRKKRLMMAQTKLGFILPAKPKRALKPQGSGTPGGQPGRQGDKRLLAAAALSTAATAARCQATAASASGRPQGVPKLALAKVILTPDPEPKVLGPKLP